MEAKKVLVFLGAKTPSDSTYTQAVIQFGEGLAQRGMPLVYGGTTEGTMAILADAVLQHGGTAIGVFPKTLHPNLLYKGLTQTFITENLEERKAEMFRLADAIVALPGSIGTWDELFNTLVRVKSDKAHRRPVKPVAVLNLNGFYDGIAELLQRSVQEGYTAPRFARLLFMAPSVPKLFEWLDAQFATTDVPAGQ